MGNGSSASKQTGTLKETIGDHEESINCMALSEDGSMLVTGSEDSTARMWSTKTDETECIGVLKGHSSYINCVAVVDIFVVTGSADSTLRKWDMTTCECLFVYEGHTARVQKLLCTGDFIFSSSYDKTVKAFLFDTSELDEGSEDKACIRTFKGHTKGVYPLIFIPAEESYCLADTEGPVINPADVLISGSADSTARSWSFDTGACLKIFKGHAGAVTTMATDAVGKILYTAGADALIKSWNISTGQVLKTFRGHSKMVLDLTLNKDKTLLFSASVDMLARSWLPEVGGEAKVFEGGERSITLLYLKGQTCKCIAYLREMNCTSLSLSFDFPSIESNFRTLMNDPGTCLLQTMEGHTNAIICMVVVNRLMYTGSADSTSKCWVTEFGDCTRQYKGHRHSVICMRFEKGVLFTGCGDGIARAYDAKSATLKRFYQGHEGAINCLTVVDDKLYTGSSDGTIRVWDAKDLQDGLNVDEEPPPAPTAVVDEGLEKELEKLESNEDGEDFHETPEDGIIDDNAAEVKNDDEEGQTEQEEIKSVKSANADDVLASG